MKARRLAIALRAVSTSAAMPEWPRYVACVEAMRPELARANPEGVHLKAKLRGVARSCALPCGGDSSAADLVTALSSFVDDYAVEPPRRLFALGPALALLDALEGARCLTAPEQLALALDRADTLFDAVLALHTVTRVLARGRDARLHPRFALSLDERLARGRAIAPFHPRDARGGDPLGDTYHFWANVAAGLYAAGGRPTELRRPLVGALLFAGPVLMRGVRQGVFGNRLFYGDHARVDRLGLAVGYDLRRVGNGVS